MENQKLPNATAVLVLGILSIVFCCCYGVVGIVMSIIALVLASKDMKLYREAPQNYTNYQNLNAGRIMAIVGLVLSIMYLLLMVWMIMTFGLEGMQDQELMQERIREMLGQ